MFPFLSRAQQTSFIKVVETASKSLRIVDLMFEYPKSDYLFYCVCFEYILSTHNSDAIKGLYRQLKQNESIYSIKRIREDFVTSILSYAQLQENTPIYIQLGQRVASFLIDETLSFGYKNGQDIISKTKSFWAEL